MVDANDNDDNYIRHNIGYTAEKYTFKAIGK